MTYDATRALRGRRAVAAMFLVNGFLIGSWAPQIPVTLARLEITEFTLGLLILTFGIGALVAMPTCCLAANRARGSSAASIATTVPIASPILAHRLPASAMARPCG